MSSLSSDTISSVLYINDSNLAEFDCVIAHREEIKRKIEQSISKIETALSVSFNYSIIYSDDSVIIEDHYKEAQKSFQFKPRFYHIPADPIYKYKYKISPYQHHSKKTFKFEYSGNKVIKLRAKSFGFEIPQSNSSYFYITFDDYFNIQSLEYESSTKDMGKFSITKIMLKFDNQFLLNNYKYTHERVRDRFTVTVKKDFARLMCVDDEVVLWQLFNYQSDDIKTLVPEYHIPSAYDFRSSEFLDRLNIFSMLIL